MSPASSTVKKVLFFSDPSSWPVEHALTRWDGFAFLSGLIALVCVFCLGLLGLEKGVANNLVLHGFSDNIFFFLNFTLWFLMFEGEVYKSTWLIGLLCLEI